MNRGLTKMSYDGSKISYVLSKMDWCHPESKSWKLPCDLWKPSYNLWKLSTDLWRLRTDLWKLTPDLLREIMSTWAHENEVPVTKLVYPGLKTELWTLKNRI